MSRVAVIGSGAWGTALAITLARRGGHTIALWSHTKSLADSIARNRENPRYLAGIPIPGSIRATSALKAALDRAEIIITVVPSEHLRATLHAMAPYLTQQQILVNATKGLEDSTYLRMTQVIDVVLAERSLQLPCCVLSGPSFAQEVAAGSPTAITVASHIPELAAYIREEFMGPNLRLYTNEDVIGVELGGALKNVIALASGVVTGLGLGHNSIAALITRGNAEMTRLAIANGGKRETMAGLAGLGGGLGLDVLGLDPTFPIKYMVYFLLVVVVGGASTIKGPLIAALILGVCDVAGKYYVPAIGSFIIYGLMVLLLVLFPAGLIGKRS